MRINLDVPRDGLNFIGRGIFPYGMRPGIARAKTTIRFEMPQQLAALHGTSTTVCSALEASFANASSRRTSRTL
jgi:hypothetical protein